MGWKIQERRSLSKEEYEQILAEIGQILAEPGDPLDRAASCEEILPRHSEPWPGTPAQIELLVEHILLEVGEPGNGPLRLLLLPAF